MVVWKEQERELELEMFIAGDDMKKKISGKQAEIITGDRRK